jgi:hypothetical protein
LNPGRWSGETRDWSVVDKVWLKPEKVEVDETECFDEIMFLKNEFYLSTSLITSANWIIIFG